MRRYAILWFHSFSRIAYAAFIRAFIGFHRFSPYCRHHALSHIFILFRCHDFITPRRFYMISFIYFHYTPLAELFSAILCHSWHAFLRHIYFAILPFRFLIFRHWVYIDWCWLFPFISIILIDIDAISRHYATLHLHYFIFRHCCFLIRRRHAAIRHATIIASWLASAIFCAATFHAIRH